MREILVIVVGRNERDTSLMVVGRYKRATLNRSETNVHDGGMIVLGRSYRDECTHNERYERTMNRTTGRMVLVISFHDYAT